MTRLNFVIIVIICIAMFLRIAFAQENALNGGTLRGQISDVTPAQNPIEGVEVKIVARDGSKEFTTRTDADGNYEHAGLPAGRYLISISKDGYGERDGKPVTIVDGGDHFLPLKMMPKGNIEPPFAIPPAERLNVMVKQRIVSLLQRFTESVGERYGLDAAAAKAFHGAILNSIVETLEQGGNLNAFAKAIEAGNMSLLEILLSYPACQAAFTEHLTEAQLQDYMDFTEARRQQDQEVVARRVAVLIDKELSLTAEQREKVVQSVLDARESEDFPISMSVLRLGSQQAVQLVHYRLKISPNALLSEAQSKVWHGLAGAREGFIVDVIDRKAIEPEKVAEERVAAPDGKRPLIHRDPVKFKFEVERKVEVVINEVRIDPRGLPPWQEINPDTMESQEQKMQIAEAKLAAHTELLGPLDERAARRLAIVAKGVAQQYIEAQGEAPETKYRAAEAELMKKVEAGEMTREQAATRLKIMRRDLAIEMEANTRGENSTSNITDHPLYQQTIKDVLSEEAFAQYTAHQAERETFHQQVLRDVVVACLDTQLLLGDTQREALETSASELIPGRIKEETPTELMFFQLFPQTVDFETLTPWQQGEFERVFGPLRWRRR